MNTIIVAAYAISPTKGSEYGVGWNFITRLSKTYHVIVLYGTSGNWMGDVEEMEVYLQTHKLEGVEFIQVKPNKTVAFFDKINRAGFSLSFYVAYRLWQKSVYEAAKEISKSREIDLVHQLNTIGFSSPGYLSKLNLPFVWGPVGGTYATPEVLLNVLNRVDRLKYTVRNFNIRHTLQTNFSIKRVVKRADGIFVATKDDQQNFYNYFGRNCPIIPENNIINNHALHIEASKNEASPVKLIWVGRMDGGKALVLLIRALEKLTKNLAWQLDVVGDGYLADSLKAMVAGYGLQSQVNWHGAVNRDQAIDLMKNADLHLLTSIKDSNPTVLLEAVEWGIPTIALNHSGMSTIIRDGEGVKLKIQSVELIVEELAYTLDSLLQQPEKILEMKRNLRCSQEHPTWDKAIKKVLEIYKNAIINYHGKN